MARKTVNLTDEEAEKLEAFLVDGTPERAALARAVGEEPVPYSESSVIRHLALLGIRYVDREMLAAGYEALAAAETDDDRKVAAAMWEMGAESMAAE